LSTLAALGFFAGGSREKPSDFPEITPKPTAEWGRMPLKRVSQENQGFSKKEEVIKPRG